MKILINYANEKFRPSQLFNAQTGRDIGGFDKVITYGPQDIDAAFQEKNRNILNDAKGAGFWLWKPYVIHRTLKDLSGDDYLFYADAGSYFVHSITPLIQMADKRDLDVLFFENMHTEKKWTKRDAFVLLDCDEPRYTESPQRQGGFSLWRPSAFARDFCEEYLHHCQDERLITDMPNQMGKPNYPEHVAHRHDQSISSLLTKKHGIPGLKMITQDGQNWIRDYPDCPYPQIVNLTRSGKVRWPTRVKLRWQCFKGAPSASGVAR